MQVMIPEDSPATPTVPTVAGLLAGTQCTQCGYPSCEAYAEALLATPTTPTNLCRPGGTRVASSLSKALNRPFTAPFTAPFPPQVSLINEDDCIGCTLCTAACPTAAIVGASKQIHTVIPSLCTGCNLCVPVCPTTCITLQNADKSHKLTQQMPDGSLKPEASLTIWNLVQTTRTRRQQNHAKRPLKTTSSTTSANLQTLPPEILAKITAAREKSQQKYNLKGPLRTPTALKKPTP